MIWKICVKVTEQRHVLYFDLKGHFSPCAPFICIRPYHVLVLVFPLQYYKAFQLIQQTKWQYDVVNCMYVKYFVCTKDFVANAKSLRAFFANFNNFILPQIFNTDFTSIVSLDLSEFLYRRAAHPITYTTLLDSIV